MPSSLRKSIHELTDQERAILKVFMDQSTESLSSSNLALAIHMPTRDLEKLDVPGLDGWIDRTFSDSWDLLCKLSDPEFVTLNHKFSKEPGKTCDRRNVKQTKVNVIRSDSVNYQWQEKALGAWEEAGRRGIIEAVTGTGKTHVGIKAIKNTQTSAYRVLPLIVVPTIPIMLQWESKIEKAFPRRHVGLIGDGHDDDFASPSTVAIVAVVNSLVNNHARRLKKLFPAKGTSQSLLIADECHHYLYGTVFSRLRQFPFDMTLGLSATIDECEVDGIGRIVYEYNFKSAHKDGLVPPFDMVNTSVVLTQPEKKSYLDLDEKFREKLKLVLDRYGDDLASGEMFWENLKNLMGPMGSGNEPLIEQLFILAFRRAAISYQAQRKLDLGQKLTSLLVKKHQKKVMVFFERINSAVEIERSFDRRLADSFHKNLRSNDLFSSWVYHSQMSRLQRSEVLSKFQASGPGALLACRCLDEGIDLPDVDAAILVSSTQSKRQRIQRIGRVLRRGSGNKKPIIITLTVKGTSDNSITGADPKEFSGVASIFEAEGQQECLDIVNQLNCDSSKV
jgi:superfamily II DNA or RNA helicase